MNILKSLFKIEFFGIFKNSPPLHFYIMQFTCFAYLAYRFLSRNYTVYGFLPDNAFMFQRNFIIELWPKPLFYFTSFQFIYEIIPRPTPDMIAILQIIVVICCFMGLCGIYPKINAAISFLIALHITGMMQSSNSEIDGGSLILSAMLILALSPEKSFYSLRNGISLQKRGAHYHWPIFLLFLFIGTFYSYAGLNKIIDMGLHWPFILHIDHLAQTAIEQSLFLSNRYANPYIASFFHSYWLSVISGIFTLIGELFFISILWLPRCRWFFVSTMLGLHILVFLMAGINFSGNSVLLFLCFNYNALISNKGVHSRS